MTNGRVVAAILLAVVVAVTAQEEEHHGHHHFRRIVHQCKREFSPFSVKNHSQPIWAAKKTISGLYDPRTHHAFRKTVVTVAKLEAAVIRDPKEAEKCMVNCIAERLRWLNHTTQVINSSRVFEGVLRFARHFNEVAVHKKMDTSKLKLLVSKCIDEGTAGYYEKECEKGFKLVLCVRSAILESIYVVPSTPTTTPFPTTTAWAGNDNSEDASKPERVEDNDAAFRPRPRPLYMHRPLHHHRFGPPPPPPQSLGMMPPPPPMGMMPPPPPMAFGQPMPMQAVPMMGGPEPEMIAYGQRAGVVEVFGRRPRFGQPWRETSMSKK